MWSLSKFSWACICCYGCLLGCAGGPTVTTYPLNNFHTVTPNLYRGAQPDLSGIVFLQSIGVRTILDINDDDLQESSEAVWAASHGMTLIYIPLSGFWAPSDFQVGLIQQVLNDKHLGPVYIHCEHGEDRTGLMVGIYRVESMGWGASEAHDEMLKDGFHTILIPLNSYYWHREDGK